MGWCAIPIFSGMQLMLLGLVLVSPCPWTVTGWLTHGLPIALHARLEEQHLLGLHGEQYQAYAARVGRFVPALGRLKGSD